MTKLHHAQAGAELRPFDVVLLQFAFHVTGTHVTLPAFKEALNLKKPADRLEVTLCFGNVKLLMQEFIEDDARWNPIWRSWLDDGRWMFWMVDCVHHKYTLVVEAHVLEGNHAWRKIAETDIDNLDRRVVYRVKDLRRPFTETDLEKVHDALIHDALDIPIIYLTLSLPHCPYSNQKRPIN